MAFDDYLSFSVSAKTIYHHQTSLWHTTLIYLHEQKLTDVLKPAEEVTRLEIKVITCTTDV